MKSSGRTITMPVERRYVTAHIEKLKQTRWLILLIECFLNVGYHIRKSNGRESAPEQQSTCKSSSIQAVALVENGIMRKT